jgi:hypothetical protein
MRFFFNFRSSTQYFRDTEGDELESVAAAIAEGRLSARGVMGLDHGGVCGDYAGGVFEITTEDGNLIGTTSFDDQLL